MVNIGFSQSETVNKPRGESRVVYLLTTNKKQTLF